MPYYTQPDLVVVSLVKSLCYMTFMVASSKASPISILRSISPRGMGITSPDEERMTIKNMLEWLFAAAAITIVAAGFAWRALYLRARNRPLRDFFAFIEAPSQRGSSSRFSIPLDRRGTGGTRAAGVDPDGRRRSGPDPDDASGNLTEKDILPAYEVKGGPPNYSQLLAVGLGASASARSQITEVVPVGVSPGTTHRASPGLNIQVPHLPPPSYRQQSSHRT